MPSAFLNMRYLAQRIIQKTAPNSASEFILAAKRYIAMLFWPWYYYSKGIKP